jgi:membrane fusion protein (multidrug efflux system)
MLRWACSLAALMSAASVFAVPPGNSPAPAATSATYDLSDKDGRIRTQFVPRHEVVLSSELAAKIASLPLREGESFRAGQTLVAFDCTLYQAQLNKSRAAQEAAQQSLAVNRRLNELNSIGALELQQAEARAKETAAELAFNQATVSKCGIAAPFAGRVAKRLVAAYQYVTPGTPLLGIVDADQPELQLIVPSRWVAWLKPGTRFSVQIDELGKSFAARVTRIGARIDPVSQSVSLTGSVEGAGALLLPGMSGWASFTLPAR